MLRCSRTPELSLLPWFSLSMLDFEHDCGSRSITHVHYLQRIRPRLRPTVPTIRWHSTAGASNAVTSVFSSPRRLHRQYHWPTPKLFTVLYSVPPRQLPPSAATTRATPKIKPPLLKYLQTVMLTHRTRMTGLNRCLMRMKQTYELA